MKFENIEEIKKYTFIIIGEEHYTSLGAVRSLGEYGIKPDVFLLKNKIRLTSKSKYIKNLTFINKYEEVIALLLKKYNDCDRKPIIIPCDDKIVEVIDLNFNKLKNKFIVENAELNGRISYFLKKEIQNKLAEKSGFNVAKTWNVEIDNISEDIIYPVITKTYVSYEGWKQDYYICNNKNDLELALKKVKGKVFIQQYIKKKNELCLDGISFKKGKQVFISIASQYTYILPDYYSMEMIVNNFSNEKLQKSFNKIFSEIRYEGIFSSEFIIDENDKLWFLEINFRNSTWSYASTCNEMNLLLLWAYGMIYGKLPLNHIIPIKENYYALAEVPDFEQRVRKHKMISIKEWLKCVHRADCLYFYNKKDIKPFLSIWCYKIKRIVLKKVGLYNEK